MDNSSTEELLSRVDAFSGLAEQDLAILGACFSRAAFEKGQVLFKEGQRVGALSIIVSGVVDIVLPEDAGDVQRFSELKLASFGPGEYFGEYSLLDMRPASGSAVVRENAELLQASADKLHGVFNEHCRIARGFYYNLSLLLIDRLRQHNRELDLFTFS